MISKDRIILSAWRWIRMCTNAVIIIIWTMMTRILSSRYWLLSITILLSRLLCKVMLYRMIVALELVSGVGVEGLSWFISLIIGTQRSTHPQFCFKTLALDRGGGIGMLEPN